MTVERTYRKGVGIVLINNYKKVFAGLRFDSDIEAWQMPQGGVDEGENYVDAAFRELEEETGTRDVTLLAAYPGILKYDLPAELLEIVLDGKFKGQAQQWYLMRLNDKAVINIKTEIPEFKDWKWVDINDLPQTIVSFKKEMYKKLVEHFAPILKSL